VVRLTTILRFAAVSLALVLSLAVSEPAGASIWSIQRAPARPGAGDTVLAAVSCTSAVACIAVGGPDAEPGMMLAERWDGAQWTIQPVPKPSRSIQSFLTGVSCTSASDCLAVGYSVDARGASAALATRWDGSRWRSAPIPRPAGSELSLLSGVSCGAASACTAVGGVESRAGVWFALVERWDGARWTFQRTPRVSYSELTGVSCASAAACTAVGLYAEGEIVEHWNGRKWWLDRSRGIASGDTELTAISCAAATACIAGGGVVIPSMVTWPVLQRWSSGRWSVGPMPAQPPGMVYGVSCTSKADCAAVGSDALVEELEGRGWSLDTAPDPNQGNLYGVSCTWRICFAVGSWVERSGREVPLVESTVSS